MTAKRAFEPRRGLVMPHANVFRKSYHRPTGHAQYTPPLHERRQMGHTRETGVCILALDHPNTSYIALRPSLLPGARGRHMTLGAFCAHVVWDTAAAGTITCQVTSSIRVQVRSARRISCVVVVVVYCDQKVGSFIDVYTPVGCGVTPAPARIPPVAAAVRTVGPCTKTGARGTE